MAGTGAELLLALATDDSVVDTEVDGSLDAAVDDLGAGATVGDPVFAPCDDTSAAAGVGDAEIVAVGADEAGTGAVAAAAAGWGDAVSTLAVTFTGFGESFLRVSAATLGDANGAIRGVSAGKLAATAVAYWITGDSTAPVRGCVGCRLGGTLTGVNFAVAGLAAGTGFVSFVSDIDASTIHIKGYESGVVSSGALICQFSFPRMPEITRLLTFGWYRLRCCFCGRGFWLVLLLDILF